jgi:oxygen-independent coproporphyrinogen-3 oxidase
LPHQTAQSWRESLDVLLSSGVDHASVYMLEVDEDSRLGREILAGGARYRSATVPTDDLVADLYLEAIEVLNRNGLAQYEISNFAHPGAESQHNIKYWSRQPYLGFGLDAHSMLRLPDGEAVRFQNADELQPYLDGAGFAEIQPISRQQALEEVWFLGLRMNQGISGADLEREFGEIDAHSYHQIVSDLSADGLLESAEDRIRLTERGKLMSNEVFARFLSDAPMQEFAVFTID